MKAQVPGVLAKQGRLAPCSDVFGVAGMAWLRTVPLDLVYRQRVLSLLELIDAYNGEVEVFQTMIAHRFTGHRGYRVIQQISGIGPTFAAIFIAEIGDIHRFSRLESLSRSLCKLICEWSREVRGEPVGVGQRESAEGRFPALDDGAFDEAAGGLARVAG